MAIFEFKGIWCSPTDDGYDSHAIETFVQRLADVGFNGIFPHVKSGEGHLYWKSDLFPQAIRPECRDFDALESMTLACRRHKVEVHPWLIDYWEIASGPAAQVHPKWAALDAKGNPTTREVLRGEPYGPLWMCPARRPGYTDQWLVPIYGELARYDLDSIHHDYIRYPGDLAPDQYCFCDYCLENLPRFAGYLSDAFAENPFYHSSYDRPYLEAHWEQSPRVLPQNWSQLDRTSRSRFLLEGSFFQGGRYDLDYFFYLYRVEQIERFARESHAAVQAINPGMKISAAVFKNPVHSGRFIGQDWRRFSSSVDFIITMDYRDHYPGNFDHYLALLAESIRQQKLWAADFERFAVGIAINFIYREEESSGVYPPEKLGEVVDVIKSTGVKNIVFFCEGHLREYNLYASISNLLA